MKKKIGVWLMTILLMVLIYLQIGREVYVCNTENIFMEYGVNKKVTLYANKLFIIDKMQFAEDIVERYNENAFNEVLFSIEPKKVEEIVFSVYMDYNSRSLDRKAFDIVYFPKEGTIYIE